MWKKADANGDGGVDFAEFSKLPRIAKLDEEKQKKLFARFDKNGDAKLEKHEMPRFGRPPHGRGPEQLFQLDADKSGGVSFEEFQKGEFFKKLPEARQKKIFSHLDTDGDGQITRKDKPPGPPRGMGKPRGPEMRPGAGLAALIDHLDTNGDKAVSFEEYCKAPRHQQWSEDEQEDRFEKLDQNGDKKLTRDDFPKAEKPFPPPPGDGVSPEDDAMPPPPMEE